jgi:hypothetical protein
VSWSSWSSSGIDESPDEGLAGGRMVARIRPRGWAFRTAGTGIPHTSITQQELAGKGQ